MLKIKNAALAASAVKAAQYPEELLPQIAMFGRSNAGKSSMINVLINRKNLARTSSAPGKTRLLNFYRVEAGLIRDAVDTPQPQAIPAAWYFVDLPGYGYAKVSKTERDNWLRMMKEYLDHGHVSRCWQLVDIRHKPSEQDIAMHKMLQNYGMEVTVIANKVDKISKNTRAAALKQIAETLNISKQSIIPFSAMSREGSAQLLQLVEDMLWEEKYDGLPSGI